MPGFARRYAKRFFFVAVALAASGFLFNNCGGKFNSSNNPSLGESSIAVGSYVAPAAGSAACAFNSQNVAEGASVTAYQTSTVPAGQNCVSEARTCTNGVLSGSYAFNMCAPNQAAACLLGANTTVPSGTSATAYQAATVPYGQTCKSETVSCNNGALSGTYREPACQVQARPAVPARAISAVRTLRWSETQPSFQNPCPTGWNASTSPPYSSNNVDIPNFDRYGVCTKPYAAGDATVVTDFHIANQNEACPSGMTKAGDLIIYVPNGTAPTDQNVSTTSLCMKVESAQTATRFVYKLSYKHDPDFMDCGGYNYCQYWDQF